MNCIEVHERPFQYRLKNTVTCAVRGLHESQIVMLAGNASICVDFTEQTSIEYIESPIVFFNGIV